MRSPRLARDRDPDKPRFADTTGGIVTLAALVLGTTAVVVFHAIPLVVGTVSALATGGSVDHNFWDILVAVWMIAGLPVLARHVLWPPKRAAPVSLTRDEELEERRAWLADLRDQGAPWHEQLAQRLSLTFVATPVLAVRRSFRRRPDGPYTPKERVHGWTIGLVSSTVVGNASFGVVGTGVALAVIVVLNRLACWLVADPRRRARAAALLPRRRRNKRVKSAA